MKIGVLLSGSGVYDGSEIHEAVLTLLALEENGAEPVCFAPDINQHHVINHLNGEEMDETRNVLVESARIARGNIQSLNNISIDDFDGLMIPGGFGAAKNINKWAFSGPDGDILPEVKQLIQCMIKAGKPIAGICMGPTVIAKALEGTDIHAQLTVGTTQAASPYNIQEINDGMKSIGSFPQLKTVEEIAVDQQYKIVTAPCYMMEANIVQIRNNVKQTVVELIRMVSHN